VRVTGGKVSVTVGPVSVTVVTPPPPGGVKTVRSQDVTVAPGVSIVIVLPGTKLVIVEGGRTGPGIVQEEMMVAGTGMLRVTVGGVRVMVVAGGAGRVPVQSVKVEPGADTVVVEPGRVTVMV
jgi:hypothetical protein